MTEALPYIALAASVLSFVGSIAIPVFVNRAIERRGRTR